MMSFKPVLLYSDILLLVLIVSAVALALIHRRNETLRSAWRRVAGNRVGMAAATLLTLFVIVGLLDSLHYRERLPVQAGTTAGQSSAYSIEVLSALDAVLTPLRVHTEKTYSAPLATHLFSMEASEDGAGRVFPHLQYGGAHLAVEMLDRDLDIALRVVAVPTG
jgi:peptide/nickel transport system permease protein